MKKEVIYMQVIHKNHMEILWHDYAEAIDDIPITSAGIIEKSSVIGRTGLMLLSCGTGAWRVRQSMNTLAEQLGLTCTADIGLMSIEYTCFDGEECYSQSLCLTNTGVNTSKLNRLEQFINKFSSEGVYMTGEELHSHLDQIEKIHGLYSPDRTWFCSRTCLWRIYLFTWRRTGRNVLCICRCRYREFCPMQTGEASFYTIFMYLRFRNISLSGLCRII